MAGNQDFMSEAKEYLISAGYSEANLVIDYRFSRPVDGDRLANELADLVAFSGTPHTIRTACIGVADATSSPVDDKLSTLRYLGTPVVLVGKIDRVSLFSLCKENPKEIEQGSRSDWQEQFKTRLSDLSPESISTAKSGGNQLTFVDSLLGEWTEQIIEQTLIRLLESLFRESLDALARDTRKDPQAEQAVIRLVCHLFACRVLEDKKVVTESSSAQDALAVASQRYPDNIDPAVAKSTYLSKQLISRVYDRLKRDFAFDSLDTEMLGHAYENAMVTPKLRKDLGIYYTPRIITKYILDSLPVESIEEEDRYFCDPCCGSGSFLLAGFERLGEMVSGRLASNPAAKHSYLRSRITGKDIDEFACEIARLSLILTDPLNKDGWHIDPKNVLDLTPSDFKKKPTIIVTNPKFKEVKKAGVRREFAADVLEKLISLLAPGGLMGVVLPQSILDSGAGIEARKSALRNCELLEISMFPGGIFYSAAETAVFFLRKKWPLSISRYVPPTVTTRELRSIDLPNFRSRRSFTRTYPVDYSKWQEDDKARFIVSPLADLFNRLGAELASLESVATVRNGIQIKTSDRTSVADTPDDVHDKQFVNRLDVLRPYALLTSAGLLPTRWLRYGPQLHRMRDEAIFTGDKVLISANRNPGSSWRLVAAIDRTGLYFSDNFHGIVPKDMPRGMGASLEEIVAVLNSPIANAWFDANCRKRKVVQDTLGRLPFPRFGDFARKTLRELVRQMERAIISAWKHQKEELFYQGAIGDLDAYQILREVDIAVYDAYGLTPTERNKVDNVMNAEKRPA